MDSFDKIIRRLRKAQKLTQAELAKEAGLTPNQLSRLEAGEALPKEIDLFRLAEVLDTDLEDLKRQYFSDKISKEMHRNGCSLETFDLAREKLLRIRNFI
ncbi:hypothetical protein TH61_05500 [Rufibacter sp. DG15C]|uniref:helix-turn-helix domain-containing protein n=1 Tax=Rufibacter sp. DG15C TaxID=1379909 RepID=UPI00078D1A13|nr:hypothetical protein TH61_05500 [Rufibacter sp. DG15C]